MMPISYLVEIILWIDGTVLKLTIIDAATIACGGADTTMESAVQTCTLCPPRANSRSIIHLEYGEPFAYFAIYNSKDQ